MGLDMPSLEPQAVQFTYFDKDPVPAFIAETKRMKSYSRQQLDKADNEAKKEQLNAIQMKVWWDIGFKEVTGDSLWLLTGPNFGSTTISSNAPGGKKWIATKTVDIKGKPVCWCIPVEVKTGTTIDVTFNENNTFDLKSVYDKAMQEPDGIEDKEQMKKLVDQSVRKNFPEKTTEKTIEETTGEKSRRTACQRWQKPGDVTFGSRKD